MKELQIMILFGGILHFAILTAGALVPKVLNFRSELAKVNAMLRQLVWVYGVFIVFTLISFGVISLANAPALVSGEPLARWFCGFVAVFWTIRLVVQLFVYDPAPYFTNAFYKLGYHGLTAVFTYFTIVYGLAALLPREALP